MCIHNSRRVARGWLVGELWLRGGIYTAEFSWAINLTSSPSLNSHFPWKLSTKISADRINGFYLSPVPVRQILHMNLLLDVTWIAEKSYCQQPAPSLPHLSKSLIEDDWLTLVAKIDPCLLQGFSWVSQEAHGQKICIWYFTAGGTTMRKWCDVWTQFILLRIE